MDVLSLDSDIDYRSAMLSDDRAHPTAPFTTPSPASAALGGNASPAAAAAGSPTAFSGSAAPVSTPKKRVNTEAETAALLCGSAATFLHPQGPEARAQMDVLWAAMCGDTPEGTRTLNVMFGRTLLVPRCAGGHARFTFDELCSRPVGSADFIALARSHHTVVVDGVPAMSLQMRDKARRFITLGALLF